MVRTADGSPVERSKSWESNPVVRTVSYDKITRINILLRKSINAHNFKNIGLKGATFVHLNPYSSWSRPCDSLVGGCVHQFNIFLKL